MAKYRNTNDAYGESGPFEAESREELADEMMPMIRTWAAEAVAKREADYIGDALPQPDGRAGEIEIQAQIFRNEFIGCLEEVSE